MADTNDKNPKASSSTTKDAQPSGGDAGQAEVQRIESEAEAKGFYGNVPDETPNEGYTLKGSVAAAKEAAQKATDGNG